MYFLTKSKQGLPRDYSTSILLYSDSLTTTLNSLTHKNVCEIYKADIQLSATIAGVAVGSCCFPDSSLAEFGTILITFIMASSLLNLLQRRCKVKEWLTLTAPPLKSFTVLI